MNIINKIKKNSKLTLCYSIIKSKKSKNYGTPCLRQSKIIVNERGYCGLHKKLRQQVFLSNEQKKEETIVSFSSNTIKKFSSLSLMLDKKLTKDLKKNYGIYFTSRILVNKILDKLIFIITKLNIKIHNILEPSCGSGEFLTGLDNCFAGTHILGIEHNNLVYNELKKKISLSNNYLVLKKKDFLKLSDSKKKFDLIIGNPPFKLLNKSLVDNYSLFFPNKVNIYALFILHCLKTKLAVNGILTFILPKVFLNSISYNDIRLYIKDNCKILAIMDNLKDNFFLGTNIETCVVFIQKKKTKSKKYFVFFGSYLCYSIQYKYLNKLLSKGKTLSHLGFTVSVGTVLKKKILTNSKAEEGYLICENNIQNNKLCLKSMLITRSPNMQHGNAIIIYRGHGNTKYNFKYALINLKSKGYLIENHLLIIKHADGIIKLNELMLKFNNQLFSDFISLYFSNQSLSKKELLLLPIFSL